MFYCELIPLTSDSKGHPLFSFVHIYTKLYWASLIFICTPAMHVRIIYYCILRATVQFIAWYKYDCICINIVKYEKGFNNSQAHSVSIIIHDLTFLHKILMKQESLKGFSRVSSTNYPTEFLRWGKMKYWMYAKEVVKLQCSNRNQILILTANNSQKGNDKRPCKE